MWRREREKPRILKREGDARSGKISVTKLGLYPAGAEETENG